MLSSLLALSTAASANWTFAGPNGYVVKGGSYKGAGSSATNALAKAGNNSWLAGTVNGGIWKTKDLYANDYSPTWISVTDSQPVNCASIVTIAVDPKHPAVVAAGCGGATSGMMASDWNILNSGDWGGVMMSYDAGDTWKMTNFPPNYYVTSIIFMEAKTMLVSARSYAFDKNKGGVWLSTDGGESFKQTFNKPVYSMTHAPGVKTIFASIANDLTTVYASRDGKEWQSAATGLDWGNTFIPGFSQIAVSLPTTGAPPRLFLGAFLVNPKDSTDGSSALYTASLASLLPSSNTDTSSLSSSLSSLTWELVKGMPCSLDPDNMPKDRLALLPDPKLPNVVYMAGNADCACKNGGCATVFRIDWSKGKWVFAMGDDTADGTKPHPDCRALVWDHSTDNLLLAQDGGVFVRTHPRTVGAGSWSGLAGTLGAMEFTSASYDGRLDRWIAGAQDNNVQISVPGRPLVPASGYVGGDGTRTEADNTNCPTRMIGGCQFAGGLTVFSQESSSSILTSLSIPYSQHFRDAGAFPFFYPPWTLNSQQPDQLLMFVNGTAERKAGIWAFSTDRKESVDLVPAVFTEHDKIDDELTTQYDPLNPVAHVEGYDMPTAIVDCPSVYDLVVGGYTDGKSDPGLIVAMSATHLYQRRGTSSGPVNATALPMHFAAPVVFPYKNGKPAVGPCSHGKTVSLTVSMADSRAIAVTGWPVDMEKGEEAIFFTTDAGVTWQNITGDLTKATGTTARYRPSGVLIMEYTEHNVNAILVGTTNGVYVTWSDRIGVWQRLGDEASFPRVKTQRLSYEAYSDVLVCATYGRGVYTFKGAKKAVYQSRTDVSSSSQRTFSSSAKFLPPQKSC